MSLLIRHSLSRCRPCFRLYNKPGLTTIRSFRFTLPVSAQKPAQTSKKYIKMGKKKSNTPGEEHLLMPTPPTTLPIVDTHTHILSTYQTYRSKYNKDGLNDKFPTIYDFVNGMCKERNVEGIVDVWCEPGAWGQMWKELADSKKWDGISYNFVLGEFCYPHDLGRTDCCGT
jgi:TatD DNase family protein